MLTLGLWLSFIVYFSGVAWFYALAMGNHEYERGDGPYWRSVYECWLVGLVWPVMLLLVIMSGRLDVFTDSEYRLW